MSRSIKFRAWHPKSNKYLWPWPEAFHIIGEVTVFDMLKYTKLGVSEFGDLIIEQFTGLTDKNGKEIYEGDVVKTFDTWTHCICFGSFQDYPSGGTNVGFSLESIDADRLRRSFSEGLGTEIIGNIHENPELLESKDS